MMVLLIKPASSQCNMCCEYCFYNDLAEHRHTPSYGTMSRSTLEAVVKKTIKNSTHYCAFAFQGGEPTIAGIEFFESVVELVEQNNTKGLQIDYSIQTNGYAIDKKWASFLAKHNFLVGLSLDGTKDVHDMFRKDAAGKGTFAKTLRTAQLLQSNGVHFNILTTVTAQTAKSIDRIYSFFCRNDFVYQQYIPCIDPLNQARGSSPHSLSPKLYGEFLCTLFRLWHNDFMHGRMVSIRYFDNLIQMLMGHPPESCGMTGQCTRQIVVEADGSVYPCDFYVLDRFKLGNLNEMNYQELEEKRDSLGFINESKGISPQCKGCQWVKLCGGGCRRDREPSDGTQLSTNYYCKSYNTFFEYAYPTLQKCARQYARMLYR